MLRPTSFQTVLEGGGPYALSYEAPQAIIATLAEQTDDGEFDNASVVDEWYTQSEEHEGGQ